MAEISDHQVTAKKGKRPWSPQASTHAPNYSANYCAWYLDLIRDRFSTAGIVLSPLKRVLIGPSTSQFRVQSYTDPSELMALCKLIGPGGVRYFDQQLNQQLAYLIKNVKVMLAPSVTVE
jgi:hypothetical protein